MALPVVDINEPGVKELIQGSVKDIANTIFASASISITAAAIKQSHLVFQKWLEILQKT